MSLVIGTLSCTILMDIFGRKIAYILEILPGVTAMLLVYSASDFGTLMAARILDGITAGGTVILGAVIIGEYTSPAYRGVILNLKTASICLGSTIVHSLGHYLHWRTIALIVLIPYAVALVIIFTWNESPAWLASRGRFAESEEAFLWLRGDAVESRAELDNLIKAQEERAASEIKSSFLDKIKIFFHKMKNKDFLQPVFVMVSSCMLLELCGRHLVPAYAADIVGGIVGNHAQSFYYTLAIDLIITVSATCSSILIKLMKTRTLLFSSGVSSLCVLASVCFYLFLASRDVVSKDRPWIPLTMFIVYFILVNLGCTPIPLALIGEILPLEHKSYGLFAFSVVGCISLIAMLKIFPYLLLSLHIYGTFALLGLFMAIMLTMLYFTLPETKDKTLQDIEDCLKFGIVQNRRRDSEFTKMIHSKV